MSKDMRDTVRALWAHAEWADAKVHEALRVAAGAASAQAWREYAHVLAVEERWLARIQGRTPTVEIWPVLDAAGAAALREDVVVRWRAYLDAITGDELDRDVAYANSAGEEFRTPVRDIVLQVVTHGQYHRGKVNLLLRQSGQEPAPVDYISWVRGAPAAVTEVR